MDVVLGLINTQMAFVHSLTKIKCFAVLEFRTTIFSCNTLKTSKMFVLRICYLIHIACICYFAILASLKTSLFLLDYHSYLISFNKLR